MVPVPFPLYCPSTSSLPCRGKTVSHSQRLGQWLIGFISHSSRMPLLCIQELFARITLTNAYGCTEHLLGHLD